MTENATHSKKLLDNPKFKEFIDAFSQICNASANLRLDEQRRLSTQFFLSGDTVYTPVHRIENIQIQGRDQTSIPLRIYIPRESKILSTMVYFHRGGWVFGNIDEADPVCRKLANQLNCIVVSVGYRLAPENPFPKPLNDCYDATQWVSENINKFGGNNKDLIICGESAGGNLAAAVALMAKDEKKFSLSGQLLIYPVISSTINDAPYDTCLDQYFLTKDTMKFFWSMYLQSPENYKKIYASPDLAPNFKGLPPTLLITAEYDPLHEEAEKYASSLKNAGVPVVLKCFPEVIHGFIDLPMYDENEKISWINEIGRLWKKLVD